MRVLVTGAYGLIGAEILARLHRDGHDIVGAGRHVGAAARRFPYARWVAADFHRLTRAEDWQPLLAGIDAVVNCVGAFQQGPRDDLRRIHVTAPLALFEACERWGPKRLIQMSAVGVGEGAATDFTATKSEADARLMQSGLDWLILRPAIVLATDVYGASAMLRGLAGMPFCLPLIEGQTPVRIVATRDVAETVAWALASPAATCAVFELAHPDPVTIADLVRGLRQWLGFPPRPVVAVPRPLARLISAGADALAWLGWRSPARSTAFRELATGMKTDPASWLAATGIRPMGLADIFAARPSTLPDRWFARLYLLKPVAIVGLALFWLATGVIALGPGREAANGYLIAGGLSAATADAIRLWGSVLDIVLGAMLCVRATAKAALLTMLAITPGYLLAGTLLAPHLWLDPLGAFTKIIPVLLATAFALAILDER